MKLRLRFQGARHRGFNVRTLSRAEPNLLTLVLSARARTRIIFGEIAARAAIKVCHLHPTPTLKRARLVERLSDLKWPASIALAATSVSADHACFGEGHRRGAQLRPSKAMLAH